MIRRVLPFHFVVATALGLSVAGCSLSPEGNGGAEYRQGGNAGRLSPGGTYTVQRGDTIYGIARQFGVSVRSLIDANTLQPPYQLTVGQVLSLNTGSDYVVVRGDSLLGISRKTGVPYATLVQMNNITDSNMIKVGQHLKLPVVASPPPAPTPTIVPPTVPTPIPTPLVQDKGGYTPLADREKAASPPPAAPPEAVTAAPASEPAVAPQQIAAVPPPPPPPKSDKGFIWPVHGDVISEFGGVGKGVHNDGINIAVPKGTPVLAAEDGVVAYSGNELRGFGNLLLIKHADGWMTAYAHNDQLLVKRGETVKRGEKIATSGDSGGVTQPQLHFELRQGTKAIDPETMLKD